MQPPLPHKKNTYNKPFMFTDSTVMTNLTALIALN